MISIIAKHALPNHSWDILVPPTILSDGKQVMHACSDHRWYIIGPPTILITSNLAWHVGHTLVNESVHDHIAIRSQLSDLVVYPLLEATSALAEVAPLPCLCLCLLRLSALLPHLSSLSTANRDS